MRKYSDFVVEQMVAAAAEALATSHPVKVLRCRSQAGFAGNRRENVEPTVDAQGLVFIVVYFFIMLLVSLLVKKAFVWHTLSFLFFSFSFFLFLNCWQLLPRCLRASRVASNGFVARPPVLL